MSGDRPEWADVVEYLERVCPAEVQVGIPPAPVGCARPRGHEGTHSCIDWPAA